jgi:glycosyltransferase involved in cell wall biosynthesis
MKIVQIVTQMEAGGAQRVAVLLAEALRQRGYDSEVWFLYLKRHSHSHLPGVKVLFEQPPHGLDYLTIARRLHQEMSQTRPDVVITHTHYANVMGQIIAQICQVPQRIAVQHNLFYTYPKLAAWIDRLLGATATYTANVAVSGEVVNSAAQYPTAYRQKLTRIYNGIPLQQPNHHGLEQHQTQAIRQRWGLPLDAPLLLNVGRMARQKNQSKLLEALTQVESAHLVILGDGELRDHLRLQVAELALSERVHFLGELPAEDVAGLLAAADLFVFPSLFEAMPMALIEAMNAGLPVVASDIPPLREALGEAGQFAPAADAQALAAEITHVLKSPELAQQLRQRAKQRSDSFSLETMTSAYEALFAGA